MSKEISDEIVNIRSELNGLAKRVLQLECAQYLEHSEVVSNSLESVSLPTEMKECIAEPTKDKDTNDDGVVFYNTISISKIGDKKGSKTSPVMIKNLHGENVSSSNNVVSKTKPDSISRAEGESSSNQMSFSGKSLEEQIGSYWLNRIGIAALVVGLVLLLTYSFQFYGPIFKVATGIILAIGLIAGGEWMDFKGEAKWYARGLIGGGWSIMFFTVYALYHIPQVKLTDNFFLDWFLMLFVCVISMTHAILRKSEIIAGLSMILSLVAIGLSDVNSFAWIASATLVCSLAYMASKLDWYKLYFWGVLGSYITFFVGIEPSIVALKLSQWNFAMATVSYIGVYWLVFGITSLYLRDYSLNRKNRLILASLVNTFCFVPYMISLMVPILKDFDYLFTLSIATVYFAFYTIARRNRQKSLQDLNLLVALSLLTHSIAVFFDSSVTNIFWLLEIPVLVYLGLRYKIKSVNGFAIFLTFVCGIFTLAEVFSLDLFDFFGLKMPVSAIHVFTASLSFAISSAIYRIPSRFNDYGKSVSRLFYLYFLSSFAFVYYLPVLCLSKLPGEFWAMDSKTFSESACNIFWSGQCLATILLGIRLQDKFIKVVAAFATGILTLNAILVSDSAARISLIVVMALLASATCTYRVLSNYVASSENKTYFYTYFSYSVLFVWSLAIILFPHAFLALRWSVVAAIIVGLGFLLKDGNIRMIGGCIFGTSLLALIGNSTHWSVIEVSTMITLFYLTGIVYRVIPKSYGVVDKLFTAQAYEVVAALTLTALIGKEVPNEWMTFAWSIEGLSLLAAGFALKDKSFRISGLSVFILVALKLLFVDLAGAETIARILSFIVAGIILLVASYVYTRFSDRFMHQTSEKVS